MAKKQVKKKVKNVKAPPVFWYAKLMLKVYEYLATKHIYNPTRVATLFSNDSYRYEHWKAADGPRIDAKMIEYHVLYTRDDVNDEGNQLVNFYIYEARLEAKHQMEI